MIRFLQVNLERSPAAHDLAVTTMTENSIDIILASEPNKNIILNGGWFMDKKRDSAIKMHNKNIKVYDAGSGEGFQLLYFSLCPTIFLSTSWRVLKRLLLHQNTKKSSLEET